MQTNRTDNRDNMPRPAPSVSLVEVLTFIRRHLWTISLTSLAALGIAVLYLVTAVPTFTAKAELVVDSKAIDPTSVSTVVESQIRIIKSDNIASAVIGKLGLAQDPEFAADQASLLRTMTRSISRLLGWSNPDTEANAARYVVESFQRKLSAKRLGPTYLVEITFDSRDPNRAAQILNAVAEKYISRQMDNAGLQDDSWVKDRLNDLSTQAAAAQKAFDDYSRTGKDAADSAATMDKLAAAAESSKAAYDNFRHVLRKTEATQQQSSPVFEASFITGASPPLSASSPKARIVLGAAIIVGALLGIAIGILRDLSEILASESAQDDAIERAIPDVVRPGLQSDASAKTRPARLTSSG